MKYVISNYAIWFQYKFDRKYCYEKFKYTKHKQTKKDRGMDCFCCEKTVRYKILETVLKYIVLQYCITLGLPYHNTGILQSK